MLSKLFSRVPQTSLNYMGVRAFSGASGSKKPSIGDAVTILQSKVSNIS